MNRYIIAYNGYNGEMLKEKDCNPQAILNRSRYNWGAGI